MRKQSTKEGSGSRFCWESLEEWVRERVQQAVQDLLEAEVTALLSTARSQRDSEAPRLPHPVRGMKTLWAGRGCSKAP